MTDEPRPADICPPGLDEYTWWKAKADWYREFWPNAAYVRECDAKAEAAQQSKDL